VALDLPPSRDLSLIFERSDVKDAFDGHCFNAHASEESRRNCLLCMVLRATLANAILEWKAICDQEDAHARHGE
jgi:hypothetical protein